MLRDPYHRFHAFNIFVRNGKAAATSTAEQAEPGTQLSKPFMVRLNESIDSQHEVDPCTSVDAGAARLGQLVLSLGDRTQREKTAKRNAKEKSI